MGAADESIQQAMDLLALDGRISVITFHSLEDRLTKQLFKEASTVEVPKGLPFIPDDLKPKMELVNRKPILPSEEELEDNNRSHSAKLRVARTQVLQDRFRRFSRVEKAFYGSIVLTAVILAISIVFMQTRILQVQSELTDLNTELEAKKTELADVRQEVNELTRYDRLSQLASSQGMKLQKENRKTVSASSDE